MLTAKQDFAMRDRFGDEGGIQFRHPSKPLSPFLSSVKFRGCNAIDRARKVVKELVVEDCPSSIVYQHEWRATCRNIVHRNIVPVSKFKFG